MKKRRFVLGKYDKNAARLLIKLGMPKHQAKSLMYLSRVPECHSKDIEFGTKLRQPEVSIALKTFRNKGWVAETIPKKKGRGRPQYIYKITKDISEIAKDIEREKLAEIKSMKNDLLKLKNIISEYGVAG